MRRANARFPALTTLNRFECTDAVATPPGGFFWSFVHVSRRQRPSRFLVRLGSHVTCFEACSGLTHVKACFLVSSKKELQYKI